jgi:hypothetical protein
VLGVDTKNIIEDYILTIEGFGTLDFYNCIFIPETDEPKQLSLF